MLIIRREFVIALLSFSVLRKVHHIDPLVTFRSRNRHYTEYKLPHLWYNLKVQRQNWQL